MSFFDDFLDKLEKLEKTMRNGGLGGTGSIKIRNAVLPSRTILPKPGHNSFSSKIKIPSATNQSKKDPLRSAQQIKNKDIKDIKMKEAQENIVQINKSRIDRLEEILLKADEPENYRNMPFKDQLKVKAGISSAPETEHEKNVRLKQQPIKDKYDRERQAEIVQLKPEEQIGMDSFFQEAKDLSGAEKQAEAKRRKDVDIRYRGNVQDKEKREQELAEYRKQAPTFTSDLSDLLAVAHPKRLQREETEARMKEAFKLQEEKGQKAFEQKKVNIERDRDAQYEQEQKDKQRAAEAEQKAKEQQQQQKPKVQEVEMVGRDPRTSIPKHEFPGDYHKMKAAFDQGRSRLDPDRMVYEIWKMRDDEKKKSFQNLTSNVYQHLDPEDKKKVNDHITGKKKMTDSEMAEFKNKYKDRRSTATEQYKKPTKEVDTTAKLTPEQAEMAAAIQENPEMKRKAAEINQKEYADYKRGMDTPLERDPVATKKRNARAMNEKETRKSALENRVINKMMGDRAKGLSQHQTNQLNNRAREVLSDILNLGDDNLIESAMKQFSPQEIDAIKSHLIDHAKSHPEQDPEASTDPYDYRELGQQGMFEDEDKFKKTINIELDGRLEKLEKRCWKGYKPTPGKKAYSDGSCQPISKAEDESSQPKVDIMQSIVHHAKNDKRTGIPLIDNMIADAKGQSRIATSSEKAAAGIPEKPELFEPESQQFPEDQLVNQIKDHIASGKSTGIPLIDNMIADVASQKRMASPAELAELRDNLKIRQQNDAKVIPLARPEPLAASEKDCDCKGCDCDKKQKEKIDPKALRKTLRDIRKSLGKNDE